MIGAPRRRSGATKDTVNAQEQVEHGTGRIINERINYAEPAKA